MVRRNKNLDKQISEDYISKKSTEDLREAKGWLDSLLELRKVQKLYNTYVNGIKRAVDFNDANKVYVCLLYTSPSPRDGLLSRMPSSA